MAILTERIENGYGYLYCLRTDEHFVIPSDAFSYAPPLFFRYPQNVGDKEGRWIWGRKGSPKKWDPSALIRPPIQEEQEVVIPNNIMPSCTLVYKKIINISYLRKIVEEYSYNEDILDYMKKILSLN